MEGCPHPSAAVGHCHPASRTPHLLVPQLPVPRAVTQTSAQPLVTEPLAARLGTTPGLAGKSQLCCQATAGGPSGSCLPRPGPPRVRSKPPRPWPGARTSSPAQMPSGSRRVGTCPRPRAGIGTRAARPPHLCLPGSPLFCAQFPHGGLGQLPLPQAQQEARGPWFPQRLYRGSRRLWVRAPRARTGLAFLPNVRWEARPA